MTVRNFLDRIVRPLAGDTYALLSVNPEQPQVAVPTTQVAKYPIEVLLDIFNEGIQDIAEYSKFFKVEGVSLLRVGDTQLKTPSDFKGFYSSKNVSVGIAPNENSDIPVINLIPDTEGNVMLAEKVTSIAIARYKETIQGVALPSKLLDMLVKSGEVVAPGTNLIVNLGDAIMVHYTYLALPEEYTLEDEISDRELRNVLKWFIAGYVVDLDMHNESSDLSNRYMAKYQRRLEKVGISNTNWNNVSLSPYLPRR